MLMIILSVLYFRSYRDRKIDLVFFRFKRLLMMPIFAFTLPLPNVPLNILLFEDSLAKCVMTEYDDWGMSLISILVTSEF